MFPLLSRTSAAASWAESADRGLARVEALTAQIAALAAERFRVLEALRTDTVDRAMRNRTGTEIAERGLRLEVAACLHVREHAAGSMLAYSAALRHRPELAHSLRSGRIGERHVGILLDALAPLHQDDAASIAGEAVRLAENEQFGTFRRKLRRLVESVRQPTLTSRHEIALEDRRVSVDDAGDGMA